MMRTVLEWHGDRKISIEMSPYTNDRPFTISMESNSGTVELKMDAVGLDMISEAIDQFPQSQCEKLEKNLKESLRRAERESGLDHAQCYKAFQKVFNDVFAELANSVGIPQEEK